MWIIVVQINNLKIYIHKTADVEKIGISFGIFNNIGTIYHKPKTSQLYQGFIGFRAGDKIGWRIIILKCNIFLLGTIFL